jgi:hypothetical protein
VTEIRSDNCPFCGSDRNKVHRVLRGDKSFIICLDCDAHGPHVDWLYNRDDNVNIEAACVAWNKRMSCIKFTLEDDVAISIGEDSDYRIRKAIVSDDVGRRRRAFIAERRRSFLGLFSFWFATPEACWHDAEEQCLADIEYDKDMRKG